MQRFTLINRHTQCVKLEVRDGKYACYLFHSRADALKCASDVRNEDSEVAEITQLPQWLLQQAKSDVTYVLEASDSHTRMLPIRTLISAMQ